MERKVKTFEQALNSLQRTCSRMERTKSDIRRSLYRFGIDPSDSEKIISKLEEEHYVDEKRYAESFVREKSSLQKWSRKRIILSLSSKGIPKEYIESAVSENIEETKENENLKSILLKRYNKIANSVNNEYELRKKLFSYAAIKGYEFDEINDILDTICKN